MYFDNITNEELQYFKGLTVPNFTIKLTDILHKTEGAYDNKLFKIEDIITGSIYRIIPLFYFKTMTNSNPNDIIIDEKCIIAHKETNETYFTFISDEDEEIQDFQVYETYHSIGDSLNEKEYNAIVQLLRSNIKHSDSFNISETVIGNYADYEFDLNDVAFLDTGILISSQTISAEPKVRLSNNVFKNSTYTLRLDVLHYEGVNILDDVAPEDFKVVDTLEIELTPDLWVDIPVATLENDYIISLQGTVEISHDKPVIDKLTPLLTLAPNSSTIYVDGTLTLSGTLSVGSGKSLKLYQGGTLLDTLTTTTDGAYTKNITGLDTGDYDYTVVYEGDATHTNTSASTSINVIKHVSSLSATTDHNNIYANGSVTLSGVIKIDDVGTSSLSVKIYNGETLVDTVTSGTDGAYSKTITGLSVGSHQIRAVYEGSSAVESSVSSEYNITVSKVPANLSIEVPQLVYSDAFSITGALLDNEDSPISGASVKLYMLHDDVTTLEATGTTNNDGEVTFSRQAPTTITTYKFWLTYDGDSTYANVDSSEESRTVGKETSVLTITSPANNAIYAEGDTIPLTGTLLTNDGEPIINKYVMIVESGSLITSFTTDNNGSFSGSLSRSVGSHTLKFMFYADSYYSDVNASRTISVSNAVTPSSISLTSSKDVLSYYDADSAVLTATVTGSDSNPYSGATVEVYKGATKLGDATDNGDGTYSYSYASAGVGDVVLTAKVYGTLLQETYAIEDCDYWNETGITKTTTSSTDTTYPSGIDYSKAYNGGNFEVSFDFTMYTNFRFYFASTHVVNGGEDIQYGLGFNRSGGGKFNMATRTTSTSNTEYGSNFSNGTNKTIKLVFEGTTVSIYVDGSLVTTKTLSWFSEQSPYYFGWAIWGTGTVTVSNIKVKDL